MQGNEVSAGRYNDVYGGMSMERNWCVYKHTSPNGKVYIGITSKSPNKRWDNGNGYKYNKHFYNSITKYGWENFKHEIVYEKLTKEEACMFEQWLITEYKSNQFKYGFNQAAGGCGGRHGVPLSEEEKLLKSKAIICLNTGKKYKSIKAAAKDLGIGDSNIGSCLRGRAITAKGYRFNYLHESNDRVREEKPKEELIPYNARAIINIDTGEEFESISKAGEHYGIAKGILNEVCKGIIGQTHGMRFRYKDEEYNYNPVKSYTKKKIKNVTTGEVYSSLSEIERKCKASRKIISACCKGILETAYGAKWEYAS